MDGLGQKLALHVKTTSCAGSSQFIYIPPTFLLPLRGMMEDFPYHNSP